MFKGLINLIPSGEKIAEQLVRPFQRFSQQEASSSVLLLIATIAAIILANSPLSLLYEDFWRTEISLSVGVFAIGKTIRHWINDGLMAFFFFTVGLEIKQEMIAGELSSFRQAFLPAAAALGGMLLPGLIFIAMNEGTVTVHGWAIPVATDIAFALGALAVLGKRMPVGLRAFLAAFAIADDLGAVLIIAFFYTSSLSWDYLLLSAVFLLGLGLANYLWVRWTLVYGLLGMGLWLTIVGSGIHATVAGILVALFIPAKGKYDTDRFLREVKTRMKEFECEPSGCGRSVLLNQRHLNSVQSIGLAALHAETPLQRLEHVLHPWIAFAVVPLFALANAGLYFPRIVIGEIMRSPLALGISLGLLVGKPVGITLFSYLAVKSRLAVLPRGLNWLHVAGAGMLGGIGFTMSLFIMGLGFSEQSLITEAKFGIFAGSVASAAMGIVFLHIVARKATTENRQDERI